MTLTPPFFATCLLLEFFIFLISPLFFHPITAAIMEMTEAAMLSTNSRVAIAAASGLSTIMGEHGRNGITHQNSQHGDQPSFSEFGSPAMAY
jgi:hypothetical protein